MTTTDIPSFIKSLEPFMHSYGYLGVGGLILMEDFGLLVPGETVLITAAYLASIQELNVFTLFFVALIAAILGDNIGFGIGKYGGQPLIDRFGKYIFLTPDRVKKAKAFFIRQGAKIIVVARFIDGLRQANGIIAGLSGIKFIKFLTYNIIGAALWVATWIAVGYYGGQQIGTFIKYDKYFSILAVILIVGFISYKVYKKQHKATKSA